MRIDHPGDAPAKPTPPKSKHCVYQKIIMPVIQDKSGFCELTVEGNAVEITHGRSA